MPKKNDSSQGQPANDEDFGFDDKFAADHVTYVKGMWLTGDEEPAQQQQQTDATTQAGSGSSATTQAG